MKSKDIMTGKPYKGKDGTDKKFWMKVGVLKTTDAGKQFIELFMFPDTQFSVFEPKPKEEHPPF